MLKGKTAMVTGANRGIGMAVIKIFAQNHADIIACARTQTPEFENTLHELAAKYDIDVSPAYFDLSDEEAMTSAVKQIIKNTEHIDILVNNAGVPHGGTIAMTPISKVREVYEINVFAQIQIIQLVSRLMIRQKSGRIINMCSVGGIETSPGYLAYGSSKAALIWITKSAAKELGEYNIRVNGIAPGLIDTDMGHYKSETELKKVFDRMSVKRMGKPEEVAKAALYLSSDEADYITGQILVIDGGRV